MNELGRRLDVPLMYGIRLLVLLSFFVPACVVGIPALAAEGDSARGEQVLRSSGCGRCHALGDAAHTEAPDLARRTARAYAPAFVASIVWNHGPAAWTHPDDESAGIRVEGEVADVLAFFCSRRYFESFGSAKRGKEFFEEGGCAVCHAPSAALAASAPQAAQWDFLRDPIAVSQRIWNSSVAMREADAETNAVRLPRVTAQELNDLFLYLENLPRNRAQEPHLSLASAEQGRDVFRNKECSGCHQEAPLIDEGSGRIALTDVAAAIWNHTVRGVETREPLSYDDMSAVVAYIWAANTRGVPARGRRVFASAGCASCHGDAAIGSGSAQSHFAEDRDDFTSLVSFLWEHGSIMHAQMRNKGIAWPRLTGKEAADLSAFLGAVPDHPVD